MHFSLNIRGKLHEYTRPAVMGILNITPDSFYGTSRAMDDDSIRQKVIEMVNEGADFIDIGAYSTRPGHSEISTEEEIDRLAKAMRVIKNEVSEIPVSVDTFRAEVAKIAIEQMGADIINDISGGEADNEMFPTVTALHVPYVLTHCKNNVGFSDKSVTAPRSPLNHVDCTHAPAQYQEFPADVINDLANKVSQLCLLGADDIIIDPGFGFGKTLQQNYTLLRDLEAFEILKLPILVGMSRKSMLKRQLNITAEEALCATTVVNTIALMKGASILRVHDVKAAVQAVKLTQLAT